MELILATGNVGKLREFSRMMEPLGIIVRSQREVGFEESVEETGKTFEENAYLKANALYRFTGLPTVADDSGLSVEALNGQPGVYSARFAGENATDLENNEKLLSLLEGERKRNAKFICSICFIDSNGTPHYIRGECCGEIGTEPQGNNGFGYDPLFFVNGTSFAQMDAVKKDEISHRGKALRGLIDLMKKLKKGE